jgi:hypothetical protein
LGLYEENGEIPDRSTLVPDFFAFFAALFAVFLMALDFVIFLAI